MTSAQCRVARKRLGWAQRELAQRARVTRAGVEGLESGRRASSRVTLARVRLAFLEAGVDVDALEDGAE